MANVRLAIARIQGANAVIVAWRKKTGDSVAIVNAHGSRPLCRTALPVSIKQDHRQSRSPHPSEQSSSSSCFCSRAGCSGRGPPPGPRIVDHRPAVPELHLVPDTARLRISGMTIRCAHPGLRRPPEAMISSSWPHQKSSAEGIRVKLILPPTLPPVGGVLGPMLTTVAA